MGPPPSHLRETFPAPPLAVIREYNARMQDNTAGPNCVDPATCQGDCCSIMIDIPRILAELYVKEGWLDATDLRRGGPFAFRLGVSAQTAKCVFFNPSTNGCRVHFTGYKPPQCWIYPAGFEPGVKTCKKGYEWDIVDFPSAQDAERLLEQYKATSLEEAHGEVRRLVEKWEENLPILSRAMQQIPPRHFIGLSWGFDTLQVADAGGLSLQMKSTCASVVPDCGHDFLECPQMCPAVVGWILAAYAARIDLFFQNEECIELLQFREVK